MNQKNWINFVSNLAFFLAISSCGEHSSTVDSIPTQPIGQTIEIHDIGHIDFPGGAGRWIMSKNVVQLMVATTRDDEGTCRILTPSQKETATQNGWTFTPKPPVIAFWRIHQDDESDNKPNFIDKIEGLFENLVITRDDFQPKEVLKKFAYLTQDHLNRVQISYPNLNGLKKNQLTARLKASNLEIYILIDPQPAEETFSCELKLTYWCNDQNSNLCKDTSEKKPGQYKPEDGFGIYMGESVAWALVSNFSLRKSEILKDLGIETFRFDAKTHQTE